LHVILSRTFNVDSPIQTISLPIRISCQNHQDEAPYVVSGAFGGTFQVRDSNSIAESRWFQDASLRAEHNLR
jgi:hypothetical protein